MRVPKMFRKASTRAKITQEIRDGLAVASLTGNCMREVQFSYPYFGKEIEVRVYLNFSIVQPECTVGFFVEYCALIQSTEYSSKALNDARTFYEEYLYDVDDVVDDVRRTIALAMRLCKKSGPCSSARDIKILQALVRRDVPSKPRPGRL